MKKSGFKVGDRVLVKPDGIPVALREGWNGSSGTVTNELLRMTNSVRVRFDDVPIMFRDMHEAMDGLWIDVPYVKQLDSTPRKNEVPSPCELRTSFVGNTTKMSLVDTDGNVECSATARCHPNDDFDVGTGMKIALERLYERYRKQNPEHSALMIGDKVRLKKGATLPLITSYGGTETPSEIVLTEVGTVTSLSPNSENAIVEWRENVVAAVATAGLEIVRESNAKPKYREGDILVTKKNGSYVRVTKDYYEWEEKVPFETPNKACDELTRSIFFC